MKKLIPLLVTGMVLLTACITGGKKSAVQVDSQAAVSVRYTAEDVRKLKQYLSAETDGEELKEQPYDLNGDSCWNAADLTVMKRELLEAEPQSSTIVVYFSRTGNTEKIAHDLIDLTGADSYVIEAAVPYTDEDIAYNNSSCRANQEQNDKTVRPEIADPIESLEGYDTVFLGYPIWWGQEPRIIDTFLERYDFSDKTVIPFYTSASSGISVSEKNIAALVPIGEQLTGRRFAASASRDDVKAWYDSLPLKKEDAEMQLQIKIGDDVLTASLAENTSAQALADLLKDSSLTLELHDYGSFEKVGTLPETLPRNDEQIQTDFGDLILYQGNQFSIYYDKNAWSLTKLGHIENVTQEQLKSMLGDGNVTVELSVKMK